MLLLSDYKRPLSYHIYFLILYELFENDYIVGAMISKEKWVVVIDLCLYFLFENSHMLIIWEINNLKIKLMNS